MSDIEDLMDELMFQAGSGSTNADQARNDIIKSYEQLRLIAKEQHESLVRMVAWTKNVAGDTYDPSQSNEEIESHNQCANVIAQYESLNAK